MKRDRSEAKAERLVPLIRLPYDLTAGALLFGALDLIGGLFVSHGRTLLGAVIIVLATVTAALALMVAIRHDRESQS